jgi:hypothetical protein
MDTQHSTILDNANTGDGLRRWRGALAYPRKDLPDSSEADEGR